MVRNRLLRPYLFLYIYSAYNLVSSEVPRPRGVPLSKAPLYDPKSDFKCFDNSKTIPFTQINDDFCDCPDASDEPGTSACPHGFFYCLNAGYKPMNIGSSRVNDGICDCCDGSDEYASDTKCLNNCVELGKTARKEEMEREELLKAGKQLREEFSQKGIQERQKRKEKLVELEQNKDEAEKIKQEKEQLKEEAESLENHALEYYRNLEEEKNKEKLEMERLREETQSTSAFHKYDLNKNDLVSFDEIQQHIAFDKDKDGTVTEEEAKYFLGDHDEVTLEIFNQNCWLKIKPYLIIESGAYKPVEDVKEEDEEEEEYEEPHSEDVENTEEIPEVNKEDQETESSVLEYDDETQKLVDSANEARRLYTEAETNAKEINTEIEKIKEYLNMDFGVDEEFAPLLGECFEYEDHEYIYKLCPFDKTIQKPKSGAMETRLGSWGEWSGSDTNKYKIMLYERGQACWNGPQRTTHVKISCGNENRLVSVTEPNKCEYVFEFVTPAACFDNSNSDAHRIHEEL